MGWTLWGGDKKTFHILMGTHPVQWPLVGQGRKGGITLR
jgi:hypothetical protein